MEGNLHRAATRIGVTYPDVVLPSQYFLTRRHQAPEKRLMIAVLHDALDCLYKYRFATDKHALRLFHETREWFLSEEADWPYAFESICSVLDLDSTAVRQRLAVESASLISTGTGNASDPATPETRSEVEPCFATESGQAGFEGPSQ